MTSTLIIQSYSTPVKPVWLNRCMDSVTAWCNTNQFEYRFIDDELFEYLDPALMEKLKSQKVIATDLARLYAIREGLEEFDRVIWLDADFLIFAPDDFQLPDQAQLPEGYMLGREVWVQSKADRPNKLRANVKVHNAFLLFDRHNSFLDFYLEHAERLLNKCEGPMPPQFVGPKLLTALHNTLVCPVLETAGMLSPLVIDDLLADTDQCCALNLMNKRSTHSIAGANLCHSLSSQNNRSEDDMLRLIKQLRSANELL